MSSANNPIQASVQALLAKLDDETWARVEASILAHSIHAMGAPVPVEDELELILVAKYLAAADGLSSAELAGLKHMMQRFHLPEVAQQHILDFDVAAVRPEHVSELVPSHSRAALYLLSNVALLAALDGLSPEEQARARLLGEHLGVSPQLVDVILAEAVLTAGALMRNDEATILQIRPLRHAIYRLL